VITQWSAFGQVLVYLLATSSHLGHHGTLLAHCHPVLNCWSTLGQPVGHRGILLAHSHPLLNHWSTCWLLEPPWGMLLAHSHPVVNHWSIPAQPVGHHWPSGHTAGSRLPCWPTVGQLRHHWPSWPEEHTAGLRSTSGQLLANQNTTPGHQGTLSAHSHPTANRTDPQVLLCRPPFQQL